VQALTKQELKQPITMPSSHQAQAGNVTELNIVAFSTTQSWQGYFGNISDLLSSVEKVLK
jgi:hypothetical protein